MIRAVVVILLLLSISGCSQRHSSETAKDSLQTPAKDSLQTPDEFVAAMYRVIENKDYDELQRLGGGRGLADHIFSWKDIKLEIS